MVANLKYISPASYLALERKASFKSEYIDGAAYAMAGASSQHNLIAGNLLTELNLQLRDRPCLVFGSDMKVGFSDSQKFFYPDLTVVCSQPIYADDERDVLLNPLLLVEVLSDSTAAFDRGKKFLSYQQIPSFQEYLLVSPTEPLVERYVRQTGNDWLYTKFEGLQDQIECTSLQCRIALKTIYAKVLELIP